MKILWVKSDFLHPTSRGGQIRTLETIRRLHARHEVHYIAFDNPAEPEGLRRAKEFCSRVYPVRHDAPPKRSLRFALQVAGSLFSPLPLAVARWVTPAMREQIRQVRREHRFDSVVCDFLAPAPNFDSLDGCVLFQHNVETTIWRRHAEHAGDPLRRAYFGMQARKMFECEKKACREAARIIAVSPTDASLMQSMFGIAAEKISAVPTGVDIDYFRRPAHIRRETDLVFVGSMDWMPNVDGVQYFVREILPLIRRERPQCTLTVVGRKPGPDILALAKLDPQIRITGTVPDVRPHLWGSRVSIVPLRIGGGTRLKIYESMAGSVPVVSTTVGAEGLDVNHPATIRLADTPSAFASECLRLLNGQAEADRMAEEALDLVAARFSWDRIAQDFEEILAGAARCAV